MKRVLIGYLPYGSNKTMYTAAAISGVGGDRISLDTIYGNHTFSREDGRWLEGPCLNFENGAIHQIDLLQEVIGSGEWNVKYECTDAMPAEAKAIQASA